MSTEHTLDLTEPLLLAGRAIYRPKKWKNGSYTGGELIAQVFEDGDQELPECEKFLSGSPLLGNGISYALLLSKAPEMLGALKWAQTCFHGLVYAENTEERAHYYRDAEHALELIQKTIILAGGRTK